MSANGSVRRIDTANYLTFKALADGFSFTFPRALEYAINGVDNWKILNANTASNTLKAGGTISLRANLANDSAVSMPAGTFTNVTAAFAVSGNPMSLLYGDSAKDQTSVPASAFMNMFKEVTTLKDASQLNLLATTLAKNSYNSMFRDCTGLSAAPSILPALTLADYCYANMFRGCTSLKAAPVLPAPALKVYCYQGMFYGCTKLNYIKALYLEYTFTNATYEWVKGVAASGTFVKHSQAKWATSYGVNYVPTGWTVQTADA